MKIRDKSQYFVHLFKWYTRYLDSFRLIRNEIVHQPAHRLRKQCPNRDAALRFDKIFASALPTWKKKGPAGLRTITLKKAWLPMSFRTGFTFLSWHKKVNKKSQGWRTTGHHRSAVLLNSFQHLLPFVARRLTIKIPIRQPSDATTRPDACCSSRYKRLPARISSMHLPINREYSAAWQVIGPARLWAGLTLGSETVHHSGHDWSLQAVAELTLHRLFLYRSLPRHPGNVTLISQPNQPGGVVFNRAFGHCRLKPAHPWCVRDTARV